VLEWDPVNIATAEMRSLSLYRNGSRAGTIPKDKLSTKISGLAVDHEYTFHLVLRTTAGTYSSERLTIRTQKMTDLTGITITPGIMPANLRESMAETVKSMGAKMIDTVRIDTTHFICTEGRGQAWEKAVELNIPVVVPDWIKGCEREGRIVGVRGYYLNADPKTRQVGPGIAINTKVANATGQHQSAQGQSPQSQKTKGQSQQQQTPTIEHTPPTPEQVKAPGLLRRRADEDGEMEGVPPTPPPKLDAFPQLKDDSDKKHDEKQLKDESEEHDTSREHETKDRDHDEDDDATSNDHDGKSATVVTDDDEDNDQEEIGKKKTKQDDSDAFDDVVL